MFRISQSIRVNSFGSFRSLSLVRLLSFRRLSSVSSIRLSRQNAGFTTASADRLVVGTRLLRVRAFTTGVAGSTQATRQEPISPPPLSATATSSTASSALNSRQPQPLTHAIEITDECAERIKSLSKIKGVPVVLRLEVQGSGCKGFSYKFSFADRIEPNDLVFEKDGSRVIVDRDSIVYLDGAVVDFKRAMIKEAFRIQKNSAAESSCSCGASFSPKMS